jgi:hypothetical protein
MNICGRMQLYLFAARCFTFRARTISVILGFAITFSGLVLCNRDWLPSVFVSASWLVGTVVGARWPLILWYFSRDNLSPPLQSSWSRAFWAGLLASLVTVWCLGTVGMLASLARILPIAISASYGVNKLACWKFNCCNWNASVTPERTRRRFPLSVLEAAASLVMCFVLCCITLWISDSLVFLSIFLILHGTLRAFSISSQAATSCLKKGATSIGGGVIATAGLALLFYGLLSVQLAG